MNETFSLRNDYIALCDLLKTCSVCSSGGEAKHFIAEGNVAVDGVQELRKTCKIRVGQQVRAEGMTITVVAGHG